MRLRILGTCCPRIPALAHVSENVIQSCRSDDPEMLKSLTLDELAVLRTQNAISRVDRPRKSSVVESAVSGVLESGYKRNKHYHTSGSTHKVVSSTWKEDQAFVALLA